MPADMVSNLKKKGVEVIETEDLAEAAADSDLLYITRIQKERFSDVAEYDKLKGSYVVDNAMLQKAKEGVVIMHPLPRVDEIAAEVDAYKGAAYFRQVRNGVFVRMALLAMVSGLKS
jgi:aspartate carbamoyltransferase catalytic subunit